MEQEALQKAIHQLWIAYSQTGDDKFTQAMRGLYEAKEAKASMGDVEWCVEYADTIKFADDVLEATRG